MQTRNLLVAAAAMLLWAGVSLGQTAAGTNPYEVRIPLPATGSTDRDQALRDALRTVIDRISGTGAADSAPDLLARAPQLVQRYGYERDASGAPVFMAAFDGPSIERELKARGLPLWGVVGAQVQTVRLTVTGLTDADAYIRLLADLRRLSIVHSVSPMLAKGDHLELDVQAEGGAGRLSGALLAASDLTPDRTPDAGSATGGLSYQWIGGTGYTP